MVKGANKIAVIYLIAGICWILFSDHFFSGEPVHIQSYKGIAYVVLTALVLWFFLRNIERRNRKIMRDLITGIQNIEKKDKHLQQERNLLRTVIDNLPDYIFVKNTDGKIVVANKALVKFVGKADESEMIGRSVHDFFPEHVSTVALLKENELVQGLTKLSEHEFLLNGETGQVQRLLCIKVPVFDGDGAVTGIVGISRDITTVYNKSRTDQLVLNIINALSDNSNLETALVASLELIGNHFGFKFAEAWLATPNQDQVIIAATWSHDPQSKFHDDHQQSFVSGTGLPGMALKSKEIQIWTDIMNHPDYMRKQRSSGENLHTGIGIPMVLQDHVSAVFTFLSEDEFYDFPHVKMVLLQVSAQIVLHLERKRHEGELERSNQKINNILESISDGFYAINDDWTVTYWNTAAEQLLTMPRTDMLGFNLWDKYPKLIGSQFERQYQKAMLDKVTTTFEEYYDPLNAWYNVTVYPSANGISVFFKDITEHKSLTAELDLRIDELALSNAELEQFAYIASHDLQEPLRMVTGFLSQLDKKYGDKLDDKAQQYIHFAVDGAVRMRKIILDLLDYSKVGKIDSRIENVDIEHLIADIIQLNNTLINEAEVAINVGEMPHIKAVPTLLQQVFQNLIVNAIRYRREGVKPVIDIWATEQELHWEFAVKDNGIGIKSDFYEKIFILFQRLHSREEYSGTGIGLSICKKIVENHGGRIWVESEEGAGSTFYFTIKK